MCGILDDVLPIVGAIGGSFIPGLGTAAGAALGGAIGGATSGWVQNHNLEGLGMGALTGGAGGYFGGGSLANVFTNLGSSIGGIGTDAAFDTSLASASPIITNGSGFGLADSTGAFANPVATAGGSLAPAGGAAMGTGLQSGTSLSGLSAPGLTGALGGSVSGGLSGSLGGDTSGAAGGGISGAPTSPGLNDVMAGSDGSYGTGITSGGSLNGINPGTTSTLSSMSPTSLGNVTPNSTVGGPISSSEGLATGPNIPTGAANSSVSLGDGGYSLEGGQGGMATNMAPPPGALQAGGYDGTGIGQGLQNGGAQPNSGMMGSDSGGYGTGITNNSTGFGLTAPGGATGKAMGGMGGFGNFMQNYGPGLMRLFNTGMNAYQQHARQNAYNNYVNQINGQFAPDSPYAQQMMQTLSRQDAAAGRNSQYGTRAVQLAAALTEARARALGGAPYFQAATATPGANILNGLFSNFNSPQGMQDLTKLGSAAWNGLSELF